jgi:ABC-type glutathione transport system ATPase component
MTPGRIAIVGGSGTGKTTLGKALAKVVGGLFVEVDAIQHFVGRDSVVAHPLQTHFRHRRRMLARADRAKILRLRSRGEVEAWLAGMRGGRDSAR